jgi:hypothetical protein
MRIRTIKPEFFTHEGLYDAELECGLPLRVAFAGLWCAADRAGRFKWEPRRLGVAILPYDEADFSRVLDALTTRGFIVKYRVGDAWFGAIPSFDRHQIINNREKASEIPEPSLADDSDATPTRDPRVTHASKAEGKGREGNGKGKEPAERAPREVSSEGLKFADWFRATLADTIRLSDNWRTSWATCFDDMQRLDNRTEDQIYAVCNWARGDSFWAANFQSPMKLRDRKDGIMYFDSFSERMKKPTRNGNPSNSISENIHPPVWTAPDDE